MKSIIYLALLLFISCGIKNTSSTLEKEEESLLYGNWEGFRRGFVTDSVHIYDKPGHRGKLTITKKELIDSSVYPAHVYKYDYYLKDDSLIKSEFKNYIIVYLTIDTLILREKEYDGEPMGNQYLTYYHRVKKYVFK